MARLDSVWVVDDDESIRWVLEKGFSENNIEIVPRKIIFEQKNLRSKQIKKQFLDSGSTFLISVMNLSISIFSTFLKNIFEK